jgi:hypothetical protein
LKQVALVEQVVQLVVEVVLEALGVLEVLEEMAKRTLQRYCFSLLTLKSLWTLVWMAVGEAVWVVLVLEIETTELEVLGVEEQKMLSQYS